MWAGEHFYDLDHAVHLHPNVNEPYINIYLCFYDTNGKDGFFTHDGGGPANPACFTIYRYSENNLNAGVAYKGKYKTCVLGFPIETLKSDEQRDKLMADILLFMSSK
jgi:hypothetical protein